MQKTITSNNTR